MSLVQTLYLARPGAATINMVRFMRNMAPSSQSGIRSPYFDESRIFHDASAQAWVAQFKGAKHPAHESYLFLGAPLGARLHFFQADAIERDFSTSLFRWSDVFIIPGLTDIYDLNVKTNDAQARLNSLLCGTIAGGLTLVSKEEQQNTLKKAVFHITPDTSFYRFYSELLPKRSVA